MTYLKNRLSEPSTWAGIASAATAAAQVPGKTGLALMFAGIISALLP